MKRNQSYPAPGRRGQRGMIGVIFLVVAVVAIVAASISVMNRSTGNSSTNETDKMLASTIVKQISDIQFGYDKMVTDGISPNRITLGAESTSPNIAMFDPALPTKYADYPITPIAALYSYDGSEEWGYVQSSYYTFFSNSKAMKPGTAAGRDDVIMTSNPLKEKVCAHINNILHGDSLTAPIPRSTRSLSQWVTSVVLTETSTDVKLARLDGCFRTSDTYDSFYMAYRVVRAL